MKTLLHKLRGDHRISSSSSTDDDASLSACSASDSTRPPVRRLRSSTHTARAAMAAGAKQGPSSPPPPLPLPANCHSSPTLALPPHLPRTPQPQQSTHEHTPWHEPPHTIRPSRSFRDSPLGTSLAMLKDRLAPASVSSVASSSAPSTHGRGTDFTGSSSSFSAHSSSGTDADLLHDDALFAPGDSAFSALTVISVPDTAPPPPPARHHPLRIGAFGGDAPSSGTSSEGSAASLTRTPRLSSDEYSSARRGRHLLDTPTQHHQYAHTLAPPIPPSPTPSDAPSRPASRSRARTVLQRLRRPLTSGSTRDTDDPPPFSFGTGPASTKKSGGSSGFSFGGRKASASGPSTESSRQQQQHIVTHLGPGAYSHAAADDALTPTAPEGGTQARYPSPYLHHSSQPSNSTTATTQCSSSLDFDRAVLQHHHQHYGRKFSTCRRPSTADVSNGVHSPLSSFSLSTAHSSALASLAGGAGAALTSTQDSSLLHGEDGAGVAGELYALIQDLIDAGSVPASPIQATAATPVDTAVVNAKVAKIIGWAETVADKERRPSAASPTGVDATPGAGAGSNAAPAYASRSIGARGMGNLESALLRSIDYLEMLVETQFTRRGERLAQHPSLHAAFEHAKHLCVPIAAPTAPLANELPTETFRTGLSPALLQQARAEALALPLTPTSMHARSPMQANAPVGAAATVAVGTTTIAPLSPPWSKAALSSGGALPVDHTPLSPFSVSSVASPLVPAAAGTGAQEPTPSELSSRALATLAASPVDTHYPPTPVRRGKDGAVSPFEAQTGAKEAVLSLTPAPRRRRRPTTAPETGAAPVFGFGAAAPGFGERSPRRPSAAEDLPPVPSLVATSSGDPAFLGVALTDGHAPTTKTQRKQNRRSMMPHSPSRSYSGRRGGLEAEAEAKTAHEEEEELQQQQQKVLLPALELNGLAALDGGPSSSSGETFEVLRSASPYEPGRPGWDARVPFSNYQHHGVSSRPGTADSVSTVTATGTDSRNASTTSLPLTGGGPSPLLSGGPQREVFTPEAFRAGPRPPSSRPSTAGGADMPTSAAAVPKSLGAGLGIHMGASAAGGGGGAGLETPLRTKWSRASIKA